MKLTTTILTDNGSTSNLNQRVKISKISNMYPLPHFRTTPIQVYTPDPAFVLSLQY